MKSDTSEDLYEEVEQVGTLILEITNYLKQNNTLDAVEKSKLVVSSLNQIEEKYPESAIEAKKKIKTYMVTQLQEVLSGIRNICEEMTDVLDGELENIEANIEAISEIAEAHGIDESLSNDLNKTSELLSQQQYNQDLIDTAKKFAQYHKGDRNDSEKTLLVALSDIHKMGSGKIEQNIDRKTLEKMKETLKGRMGPWAKFKARMGYSRTGKILKMVDSKVQRLNDKANELKVQRTRSGTIGSKKRKKNSGNSFGI